MEARSRVRSGPQPLTVTWSGSVTSDRTPRLRHELFSALAAAPGSALWLDVREVVDIDHAGLAVLVGVLHRAASAGQLFVLVDDAGVVTRELARMHLDRSFLISDAGRGPDPQVVDLRSEPRSRAAVRRFS